MNATLTRGIMCYIICNMNESAFDFSISCICKSRATNMECCLKSEAFTDCTFQDAPNPNNNLRFKYIHANGAIFANTFESK